MAAARWWNCAAASASSGKVVTGFLWATRSVCPEIMLKQKERDDVSKSSRSSMQSRSPERKSIVLIEQPDPGRFASGRLGEQVPSPGLGEVPWLAFFPDSDPPRLGHFPDSRFDRLELLLTGLLQAAPVGPALAPLGAPLFGVRAFDVGIAGPGKGFPRRGGPFVGLFGGFCRLRRWLYGLRGRYVVGGLLFGAGRIGGWQLPPLFAAVAAGCVCGCCWVCSWAGAAAGFVAATCGTGSAGAVETVIGSADILRSSLDTACEGGLGNVRSQIATAETGGDRHDHGSHACKISRRYPHGSAPLSTRATRGMGRCSGTAS